MFDIGFGELLLLAVVALVVLGPERLPHAARTFGTILRRLRNGWDSVREEVEREIQAEEMKRNLKEAQEHIRRAGEQVRDGIHEGAEQVRQAAEPMTGAPLDEGDDTSRATTHRGKDADPPDHAGREDRHER